MPFCHFRGYEFCQIGKFAPSNSEKIRKNQISGPTLVGSLKRGGKNLKTQNYSMLVPKYRCIDHMITFDMVSAKKIEKKKI